MDSNTISQISVNGQDQRKVSPEKMRDRFKRQLTISKDDPFAMVFIDPEVIKKQIAFKLKECF